MMDLGASSNFMDISFTKVKTIPAAVAVELREDAAPGAPVLALSAADPDEGANGEVVYGFGSRAAPEVRRLFRLDPHSGRLTLAAPLDYERQRAYELDVEARDRGASPLAATCTVLVRLADVNDNAPGIRLSPLGLGAAGPPGPGLGAGGSPEPSPSALYVRCTLHGHEHFALRRAYGDSYVLVTAAALDRERLPEYNLTLVAEDLGTPPFRTVRPYTVRLRDENDNAPLFAPLPLGRVIYRLLEAQVAGAPISTYVSLDPTTGVLRALCTLDYEALQSHVHVHVLDGFLIAHIAAQDADEGPNAELSYSIAAGAHDLFALHEHTGVLWLRRRLQGGEERKGTVDSQGQVLISSHSSHTCQEGLSASSLSAHSTPDQFSVKDSGKGDSEFNDSDSDISGEGLKKTPSQIMEKQLGTVACEATGLKANLERHDDCILKRAATKIKDVMTHCRGDRCKEKDAVCQIPTKSWRDDDEEPSTDKLKN
ncbi:hypothetical protein Y1Q_0004631 [Alligator mississippiensis]|uniref:Cadherin domain-containing protein n=1 Tax=Alligator mississippiensis TaxID=8496 RepID=A0A151MHQ0_ALLMI|nr:hypothetical protein Y1Q_0004631 [Alligator mississippiensis]